MFVYFDYIAPIHPFHVPLGPPIAMTLMSFSLFSCLSPTECMSRSYVHGCGVTSFLAL